MRSIIVKATMLAVVVGASGLASAYTETFPDPLGGWKTRWLGVNSDLNNYYVVGGNGGNEDDRGNNPEGLWLSDGNGNNGGPIATININPAFGATLKSFGFGTECFVQQKITIYDMGGNALGSAVFSGGGFEFDHKDRIDVVSGNGIGKIVFDSTQYGNGQIEGNTSVDNFRADPVPEPATLAALAVGIAAMARRRRR